MTLPQLLLAFVLGATLLTVATFLDCTSILVAADGLAVRMAGWWMPVWEVVVEPWL